MDGEESNSTKKKGEQLMTKSKLIYLGVVVLVQLLLLSGGVHASQLVDQTWLTGTEIRTTYGQFVDEIPRPARVGGANDLTISEHEFQQKMLPSTFNYPAPFTGTYVWGFGAQENGPFSYRTVAPSYPGPTVVVSRYLQGDPRSLTHVFYDN
jgi:hypothetical protein